MSSFKYTIYQLTHPDSIKFVYPFGSDREDDVDINLYTAVYSGRHYEDYESVNLMHALNHIFNDYNSSVNRGYMRLLSHGDMIAIDMPGDYAVYYMYVTDLDLLKVFIKINSLDKYYRS